MTTGLISHTYNGGPMSNPDPLIVIVGPTASGKSALAMQIAQSYNGEIIAADSRTIYRGMDIGTAKPSKANQHQIRHHLLDIREPDQSFSAAEFKRLAEAAILDISSRRKLPILVGGTGLYVDAIIFDYKFGAPAESSQRAALQALGVEELQVICRRNNIDMPINKLNKRHLIRAIELGGLINHKRVLRSNTLVVALSTEKSILEQRVRQRLREMLRQGVLDEVARLGRDYQWSGEAFTGNIYGAFRGVVEGTKSLEVASEECITSDMRLAKRQMTWFRRNPHIFWSESPAMVLKTVDTFLHQH
jgi:tRNA dimethylallyltransferase